MQRDLDRETVMCHFLLQRGHFASIRDVVPAKSRLGFTATYNGKKVTGVVLVQSSDYWQQRLHMSRSPVSLVVCHRHDTIVPVDVLSLEEGREYPPESLPKKYESLEAVRKEGTRYSAKVLLGALLCGVKGAHDMLQAMPESTRRKYEAQMHKLQRREKGRPLAV